MSLRMLRERTNIYCLTFSVNRRPAATPAATQTLESKHEAGRRRRPFGRRVERVVGRGASPKSKLGATPCLWCLSGWGTAGWGRKARADAG